MTPTPAAPTPATPTPAAPRRPIWRLVLAMAAIPLIAAFVLLIWLPGPGCGCSASTPPQSPQPSPVDGVVVRVDATGLANIQSFDLRLATGAVLTLKLGTLENPTEFSPSHLAEHQATSSPIRAYFREVSGDLVVYRLEDAPA